MKLKNTGWLIWIALAYLLCLMPSSWLHWLASLISSGGDGSSFSRAGDWLEWTAHAILMGGAAYSLFRLFNSSVGWLPSLLAAMFLVLLIALSIEWLQGLLPPEFHRGPSISDIWASLAGGLLGTCAALIRRPKIQ